MPRTSLTAVPKACFSNTSSTKRAIAASQRTDCGHGNASRLRRQTRLQRWLLNGSGIRDTARVLHVSTSTVIKELKKKEHLLQQVNLLVLEQLNPEQVEVEIRLAEVLPKYNGPESELDEMWSYVTKKENQRWLWQDK